MWDGTSIFLTILKTNGCPNWTPNFCQPWFEFFCQWSICIFVPNRFRFQAIGRLYFPSLVRSDANFYHFLRIHVYFFIFLRSDIHFPPFFWRVAVIFCLFNEICHSFFHFWWDRTSNFHLYSEIGHPFFVRSDMQFFPLFLILDFTFRPSASSGPRFQHFWDRTSPQSEIGLYSRTMKSGPIAGGATQVNGEYLPPQTQGVC